MLTQPIQALAPAALPVGRQPWRFHQPHQFVDGGAVTVPQVPEPAQGHRISIASKQSQNRAGHNPSRLQHPVVPARHALGFDELGGALDALARIDFPAGAPRLRDLHLHLTERVDIPDAHLGLVKAIRAQILAQSTRRPVTALREPFAQARVMRCGEVMHRLVGATVDSTIRLRIALQAVLANPHRAGERLLEDAGGAAITGHGANGASKQGGDDAFHHAIVPRIADNRRMSEIELHRKLLGDHGRNQAFHQALRAAITPGQTTVADLGAGTGFLSFLARRLGARACWLYEYSDALGLARQLARANGIDGLHFVEGHSGEVDNPPAVDLVVSETLGNYALEEGLLETLVDARRYLKPGGQVLPQGLRQYVAPVSDPALQAEIDIWSDVGFDLDLARAREVCLNNLYVRSIDTAQLGAAGQCWETLDFRPTSPAPTSRRSGAARFTELSSTVHGLALWWVCELWPGIAISTAPDAPPTHWQQIYLPLLQPLTLAAGDALEVTLTSDTRPDVGLRVQWQVRQWRGDQRIAAQQLDSFKGRL